MLLTADWVVPVTGAPIRNGAVRFHGTRIADVGPFDTLKARFPADVVHSYTDCVIAPGLVNAHTHLSLTSLAGLLPPGEFSSWLSGITPAIRALDHDDFAASAQYGALLCLRAGVTAVGDIAYGPEGPAAAADMGLGGVYFWEVLGISPDELDDTLDLHDFPAGRIPEGSRVSWGLSPHTVYTSGPDLIRAVHRRTGERGLRMLIHAAESPAELRLLAGGTGPLAPVAARMARGFKPPGVGAIRYLERLGALADSIAVHCVQLMAGEPELLATRAAGVVLCPRSNRHLRTGTPPVKKLRELGAMIAVGTDSHASNADLDLFEEARALRAIDPEIQPHRLLSMMTLEAAMVLGIQSQFGALVPGYQADIIAVETGPTDDPVAALVERGSAERVRVVISGGVWRIIDGQPTVPTDDMEKENARVAAKAARAIEDARRG